MSEQNQMSLPDVLKKAEKRFEEVAPPGILFESEYSYAIQLFNNNSFLKQAAESHPTSALSAMMNVASVGLSLNPAKSQAYLIPRNIKVGFENGKPVYQTRVFFDPSYRGLCDIATGTGCVEWIQADIVREQDSFRLRGVNEMPIHERDPFKKDRGEVTGAYCVAKLPSGDYLTTAMSLEELHKVRDGSEAWKASINKGGNGAGPWKDWPEEMMKKTVVRRAFKMWPKAKEFSRMAEAVNISNENEGMEHIETQVEAHNFTADQQAYFQQMMNSSDAIGMFLFMCSLDHGVQTALFNSFPTGQKTSGKQIVRELQAQGRAQLIECRDALIESARNGDDLGANQIIDELEPEAIAWIIDEVDTETGQFIRALMQEAEA